MGVGTHCVTQYPGYPFGRSLIAPCSLRPTILVNWDHAQVAIGSQTPAKGPLAAYVKQRWCAGVVPKQVYVLGCAAPTRGATWGSRQTRLPTSLVYRVRQASSCCVTRVRTSTSGCYACLERSWKCAAWGTMHLALSIAQCASFAVASPSLGTCMKSSIVHNSYFMYERFIY